METAIIIFLTAIAGIIVLFATAIVLTSWLDPKDEA